ncbi:unnamed protein product [Pleuronectes platessa]|uniref:Uncharacterized protein n=1 Tax=Pleuronectes platessa TaxID=8262 RepID=A0A9N7U051_PLEPL|nr:unnamed protein product [Pleuronectes platessa]
MSAARKALRGASERHGEGVPRWRGRSYLSVSVKTQKHTLAFSLWEDEGTAVSPSSTSLSIIHLSFCLSIIHLSFCLSIIHLSFCPSVCSSLSNCPPPPWIGASLRAN